MSLLGVGVVQLGLALGIARVAVERRPGEVVARRRVVEQRLRVLRIGGIVGRADVVGMQRPVVVVAEDLRVQVGALQRAADRDDQPGLLVVAQVHPRVGARIAVLGLVLQRDGVDRHAGAAVLLDEAHEVARIGVIDARVVLEAPADQRVVGLHPRRRAPRGGHDLQPRVQSQRLAQQGQDLGAVVGDREVLQAEVGLARRGRRRRCSGRRPRSPTRPWAGAGS